MVFQIRVKSTTESTTGIFAKRFISPPLTYASNTPPLTLCHLYNLRGYQSRQRNEYHFSLIKSTPEAFTILLPNQINSSTTKVVTSTWRHVSAENLTGWKCYMFKMKGDNFKNSFWNVLLQALKPSSYPDWSSLPRSRGDTKNCYEGD